MKNLFLCFGFLLLTMSCNNSKVASSNAEEMNKFEVLYQSEYGGSGEEKTEVFTDAESFSRMWNETMNAYSSSNEVPEIDFSTKMVVAQHFQSQNSGGTTDEVQSVKKSSNKTEIFYKATAPEGMATMAITNPLLVVVIDKTANPEVEFKSEN